VRKGKINKKGGEEMPTPEARREITNEEIKRNAEALGRIKEELKETLFKDSQPEYGVSGCEVVGYEVLGRYGSSGPVLAKIQRVSQEGKILFETRILVGRISPDGKPFVVKFEELKEEKRQRGVEFGGSGNGPAVIGGSRR
jgi:hypothetical protein